MLWKALEKRLSENWGNEAAWAYMRSDERHACKYEYGGCRDEKAEEEAKNSIGTKKNGTNAPRLPQAVHWRDRMAWATLVWPLLGNSSRNGVSGQNQKPKI